jgi:hypothetical protein
VFDTTGLTATRYLTEPTPGNVANGTWKIYAPSWWTFPFDITKQAVLADATNILNVTFVYRDTTGALIPTPSILNKLPATVQIFINSTDSRAVTKLKLVGGPATAAGRSITNSALRSFSTTVYLPNISP